MVARVSPRSVPYKKERIQIAYEDTPHKAAAELGEPHEEGDEAEPPAVAAGVFVASSFYEQTKHVAGMSFIHNQFMDRFKSGVRYFYSCRVDTKAVHYLVNLLAPARQTSSSYRGEIKIEELWCTAAFHQVKPGDDNKHIFLLRLALTCQDRSGNFAAAS